MSAPMPFPHLTARPKLNGAGPQRDANQMLLAIRSDVEGASLENVCAIVRGVPYAPRGSAVVHPGDTSSMIELPSTSAGAKGAVYFELSMGDYRIPLITDEMFDVAPGTICVLTIDDRTRAHGR